MRQALALARHANDVESLLEIIEDDPSWMRVLRCRLCGRHWVEDWLHQGFGDLRFIYPIETDDPRRWLDRARTLDGRLIRDDR
jgi:hypothetical protein